MGEIELRLFATLSSLTPEGADRYPVDPGTTIGQLIDRLELPPAEAKLIFVNGVRAGHETILQGGERVGIFPPVGGG